MVAIKETQVSLKPVLGGVRIVTLSNFFPMNF